MSTIDERIVQMSFDNRGFENGVNETVNSINGLNRSLDGLNNVGFDGIQNGIDSLNNKFSLLGIAGMTAISNITSKIVDMGLSMANNLTFGQINEGFQKYASATKDIKALINSTGKDIETIEAEIEKLAWYSDATSYSYSAMVTALKSFAAQDLDTGESITMIQGIGNSLSYAGLAAEEASAAFDIYSKAIGRGYMDLLQWKRLQTMGAVTAGLKKNFLEAAAGLGTLKSNGDGTYKTLNGLTVSIKDFDQTLGDQKGKWLTTDVISSVMTAYGSYSAQLQEFMELEENQGLTVSEAMDKMDALGITYDEMGKKAFLAAQEARTFKEAVNAIADASSTVWNKIFHNVLGNAEEATELWTAFSDWLYDQVMPPLIAVRDLTTNWKDSGGRDAMIKFFSGLASALDALKAPIKAAFSDIFEPFTGEQLANGTRKLAELAEKMKLSEENAGKLRDIFDGVFSVLKLLKDGFLAVAGVIAEVLKSLSPLVDIFLSLGDILARYVINGIEKFRSALGLSAGDIKSVSDFLAPLTNKLQQFADFLNGWRIDCPLLDDIWWKEWSREAVVPAVQMTKEHVKALFDETNGKFNLISDENKKSALEHISNVDRSVKALLDERNGKFMIFSKEATVKMSSGTMFKQIRDEVEETSSVITVIFNGINTVITGTLNVLKNLGDYILNIVPTIGTNLKKLGSNIMENLNFSTLIGAGLGAGALVIAKSVSDVLGTLSDAIGQFIQVGGADGPTILLKYSGALALLALALGVIASIPGDQLVRSTAAIGTVLAMFMHTVNAIAVGSEKLGGAVGIFGGLGAGAQMTALTTMMVGLAISIGILALALKHISELDLGALAKGITGIGILMAEMAGFTKLMQKNPLTVGSAMSVLIIAGALVIMSHAVENLGSLDLPTLAKGIGSIGIVLLEMAGFAKLMSSQMLSIGDATAVLIISGALVIMSHAIENIGGLDLAALAKGLLGIGIVLAEMVTLCEAMSVIDTGSILKSSVTVGILAGSMVTVGLALQIIGSMNLEQLGVGLLGMAGAMVIFGEAMAKIPANIGAAGGILVLANAMIPLATALAIMGTIDLGSMTVAMGGIAGFMTAAGVLFTKVNPAQAIGVSTALVIFATALDIMVPALVALSLVPLESLAGGLLVIFGALLAFGALSSVLSAVIVPMLGLAAAMALIGVGAAAFGAGLTMIAAAGVTAAKALVESLKTLLTAIPNLVASMTKAITALGKSILQGLITLLPDIFQVLNEALGQFLRFIVESVPKICETIVTVLPQLLETLGFVLRSFLDFLAENMPYFVEKGIDMLVSICEGLAEGMPRIVEAALDLIESFLKTLTDNIPRILDMGVEFLKNLIAGIWSWLTEALGSLWDVMGELISKIGDAIGEWWTKGREALSNFLSGVWEKIKSGEALTDIANAIGEFITKIGEKISEWVKAGKDAIKGFLKGFKDEDENGKIGVLDQIASFGSKIISTFKNALGIHSPSTMFAAAGSYAVQGLVGGIASAIKDSAKTTGDAVNIVTKSIQKNVDTATKALAAQGNKDAQKYQEAKKKAEKEAAEAAKNAKKALRDELRIKSPSKVFAEIGQYMMEGLIVGMKDREPAVLNTVTENGRNMVDTFKESIANLASMISSIDDQPTITPVLDLTGIQNGSKELRDMMASMTGGEIELNAKTASVTSVLNDILASTQKQQQTQQGTTFIQNNYSPKALSQIDIYRQTRNQLLMAKGAL